MKTWKFAGEDLSEYGLLTHVSSVFRIAKKRGDNILIPLTDGRVFARKYYDQQTITLGITISEADIGTLETRIDALKKILGLRTQGLLQQVFDNESIRQAYAEAIGDPNPNRISPVEERMAIDFVITDPFLRNNILITNNQTIDSSPKTYTLNNPGTAEERKVIITLTGPLSYVKVENLTNGVWVGYNNAIGAGNTVVIDCDKFTAVASGNCVLNDIIHSGDTVFLALLADDNLMKITSITTGGSVKIESYPPFL
jgi:hypothetical protein